MQLFKKDDVLNNTVPLLTIFFVTLFSWPSIQEKLGVNGVFAALCAFIPLLPLREAVLNNNKAPFIHLVYFLLSFSLFLFGLKEVDWNKHHWQLLHAVIIASALFLNFSFFRATTDQALTRIKKFFDPFFPAFFLTFFLLWYIRSTHGIEFSFKSFWFFITLLTFILSIFSLFSTDIEKLPNAKISIRKTLFYFCIFLFIVTFIWSTRAQFAIEAGQTRLLWGVSLFLILCAISNGFSPRIYKETLLGKIAAITYLSLAVVYSILAIVELAQHGPVESRFYHFFITTSVAISFLPSLIKLKIKYPLRLHAFLFLSVITFIGPLNITKMSIDGQKSRLWSILEKNKMTKEGKVIPSVEIVSNEDRLEISSIVHYIYHNHQINEIKEWFTFDIEKTFRNATPFVVTADFDQDLANLKALLGQLNIDYTPKAEVKKPAPQKPGAKARPKRISFNLVRLSDGTNSDDVQSFNKVIKNYARPFNLTTKINGQDLQILLDPKDNTLGVSLNQQPINRINLNEKFASRMVVDEKTRYINMDLKPEDIDIEFDTKIGRIKIVIYRVSGYVEDDINIIFNHFDALTLIQL